MTDGIMNCKGIYGIKNTKNNKMYIGATTNSFRVRRNGHVSTLNRNIHRNRLLQQDWNIYGKESFVFVVLEICNTEKELNDKEQFWIKKFDSRDPSLGYNLMTGGLFGNHANSSKNKSSFSNIGKIHKREESKYIGVYLDSINNKWRVILSINGRNKSFGSYSDEISAAKVHDYYSFKSYNRLDILNFPNDFKNGLPCKPPLYPVTVPKNSKNKYRGITKVSSGWQVQIRSNGKFKYIGIFKTDVDGANAYDHYCWEIYHDLKRLNFPQNYL